MVSAVCVLLAVALAVLLPRPWLWKSEARRVVRAAVLPLNPTLVSVELADAPPGATDEKRVQAWLSVNRATVVAASLRFRVSARAVAGVIAYEALEDKDAFWAGNLIRYSGPGKVHYRKGDDERSEPLSVEAERRGYLTPRTTDERRRLLARAPGAILYIAAIMRMLSDAAARHGRHISCRPDVLATLYTGWDLAEYQNALAGRRVISINSAGRWVRRRSDLLSQAMQTDVPCGP